MRARHRQRRLPHRLRHALSLANRVRDLRALILGQPGLVVERLELRRSAGLVQKDDALGLRCEMRQPDQPARLRIARLIQSRREQFRPEQRAERRHADAPRRQAEQLPPRQVQIELALKVHERSPTSCLPDLPRRASTAS